MFNLSNKVNQVRDYIQKLNSEIEKQLPKNESEKLIDSNTEIHKESKKFEKIDDSDIKLTKRNYALDQFIRKRDYIQNKIKEKREDRLKYKITYTDIENLDDFLDEKESLQFKKNWKSLDIWLKKNRIIDYIDRYFNNEIEINFKSNEDKVRIDKFVKLLDKKINNKPKKYIDNMIKKLETAIKYDKNTGIIKNIEYFKNK